METEGEMGIKMRIVLTTAVLAVAIFAVASGQSTSCVNEFLRVCNDANTTTGLQSCCAILTQYYRTDRPCFCVLTGSANVSNDDLVQLLNYCGETIAAGTPVCSAGGTNPSPPPDLYSPEPPSDPYTSPPHPVVSNPPLARPPPPNRRSPVEKNVNDSPSKSQLSKGTLVGIIVGALAFLSLLTLLFTLILRRRNYTEAVPPPVPPPVHQHDYNQQPPPKNQSYGLPQVTVQLQQTKIIRDSRTIFTYEELEKASDGFAKYNFLGSGAFGVVHGGTLVDGTQVAIKQLMAESLMEIEDFKNEVETISRVHHNNLVSLVGYCCTKDKRLMVLELVPNGTLESHLHTGKPGYTMDWSGRMKVALGSAKGLAYLHEDCHPQIVHRDIKAANILLDNQFVAKVADFGLAKKVDSHTVRIVGTPGYIDPEYQFSGQPTAKSDVYSFGVILLELITGRKPIENNKRLVDWVRPLLSQALINDNLDAIVDERLGNNYIRDEMIRVICCSASCIRRSAGRPLMSRVAHILEGLVPIEELKRDFLERNQIFSYSSESFGYESSHQSNAGIGNFNVSRVRSGNNTSDSFTGTSGDYDQNPFPNRARIGR